MVIDVWQTFAREHGWRFVPEPDATIAGRHEGVEIEVSTHRGLAGGWITEAIATPRIALHGTVTIAPARGIRRLLPSPLLPGFTVKSSSESVARTILDQRVLDTLRRLGERLVELEYTAERIELSWMDTDRDVVTLEDAIACVAYLAVASARTPYR